MHILTENSIKRLFHREVYRQGVKCFQKDQVINLSYDLNHKIWTAQVIGTTTYYVEVDLKRIKNGTLQVYCECPAFKTYDACKHNVAVLLAIVQQQKQSALSIPSDSIFSKQAEEAWTRRFIETIKETEKNELVTDTILNKQPMNVEYELIWSNEQYFYLKLKTGIEYRYVVRNIDKFLEAIETNEPHHFTHNFQYLPNEHYFFEQDLQIFHLLRKTINHEKLYEQKWSLGNNGINRYTRSLMVPPIIFPQLIQLLAKRRLTVVINEVYYEDIKVIKDELPYTFELIESKQKDLRLKLPLEVFIHYYPPYNVVFLDHTFYLLQEQQSKFLDQVRTMYFSREGLFIPKEKASIFLSDLLPTLQRIAPVHIDKQVELNMIQEPLRAKIYLDIIGDAIIGTLEYHYGKNVINPFLNTDQTDSLIIRDRKREEKIMQLIEQANFFYNGAEIYIDLNNDDKLFEFLHETLPIFEEHMDVYLTSTLRQLINGEPIKLNTKVTVNEATQLLEVNFDMTGIKQNELDQVLQSVIEKKRYHRLKHGAFIKLDETDYEKLYRFSKTFNISIDELTKGPMKLPLYHSSQIAEIVDVKDYDKSFATLLQDLTQLEQITYDLPKDLQATLRPYQKTGYQWFKTLSRYHLGGILADDMGLGKTLQTIAFLLSNKSDELHLVIAPSSVIYNWKSEIRRFAPDLEIAMITGTQEEREQKIAKSKKADVWLTSYAMARRDVHLYETITFQTLILDEAQYVKNYETKTSKAIRKIQAKHRFALSGTPIENNIDELWAIFQVIMPGFLPSRKKYHQLDHETIAKMVHPFILRRLKKDVLEELPEKIETTLYSELTLEQKELYLAYLQKLRKETETSLQKDPFQQQRMKILAGLTRLRQICCHPSMFIENYAGTSGKLEQLIELVNTSIDSGHRILIFSQFTSMHDLLMKRMQRENIGYFYLHGGTPSKERQQMSERFNNGEKDVFLISLRAGGTGLNLTGADMVVLYDLWWNPAVEDQAADRAYRFGQEKVVQVIRLICEGTIEEKIYELQQRKRELIDQVIQPGEASFAQLTEADVKQILDIQ